MGYLGNIDGEHSRRMQFYLTIGRSLTVAWFAAYADVYQPRRGEDGGDGGNDRGRPRDPDLPTGA